MSDCTVTWRESDLNHPGSITQLSEFWNQMSDTEIINSSVMCILMSYVFCRKECNKTHHEEPESAFFNFDSWLATAGSTLPLTLTVLRKNSETCNSAVWILTGVTVWIVILVGGCKALSMGRVYESVMSGIASSKNNSLCNAALDRPNLRDLITGVSPVTSLYHYVWISKGNGT